MGGHLNEYIDFDLEITGESGGPYSVAVIGSPAGNAREVMRFPFGAAEVKGYVEAIQSEALRTLRPPSAVTRPAGDPVRSFGRALFDALLTGQVRSLYDVSLNTAGSESKGLRLRLRILPPELAALPWEFLYDSRLGDYVCLSSNTPIVRYPEVPQAVRPLSTPLPLRVLAMISNPSDREQLNTTSERERMEKAVRGLKGRIELTWLEGATWRELQSAMQAGPWHIFHFIGHGGFDESQNEGLVALTDEDRRSRLLDATGLARLLADHRSLRLVVLNSCEGARAGEGDVFSSTAATLVRRGIAAVLAMQYEITDQASIQLARVFYENIAQGQPVDTAVSEARKAISLDIPNSVEWGIPVLFMRSPDGFLFATTGGQTVGSGAVEAPVGSGTAKGDQGSLTPRPPRIIPPEPQVLYPELAGKFNEQELRDVCLELKVDYEDLGGGTRAAKARELVLYMQRRSRLPELAALVGRLRPDA